MAPAVRRENPAATVHARGVPIAPPAVSACVPREAGEEALICLQLPIAKDAYAWQFPLGSSDIPEKACKKPLQEQNNVCFRLSNA